MKRQKSWEPSGGAHECGPDGEEDMPIKSPLDTKQYPVEGCLALEIECMVISQIVS